MPTALRVLIVIITGYAIGSVPVADFIARRRAGLDLRSSGDRNPGYWNAKELLGRRAALPVLFGDATKGALATGAGVLLAVDHGWGIGYAGAAAAMIGHAYPAFAGFRGGRSVSCFAGAVCVLSPVAASIAIGLLLAAWATGRSFAIAARVGVFGFPLAQLLIDGPHRTAASGGLMTIIGLRFALAARSDRDHETVLNGRATADPD